MWIGSLGLEVAWGVGRPVKRRGGIIGDVDGGVIVGIGVD